jgi:hypothetical protein
MDNIDMSAEAITFRLKKVSQLRKLCLALKNGGIEKQPLEENGLSKYSIDDANRVGDAIPVGDAYMRHLQGLRHP